MRILVNQSFKHNDAFLHSSTAEKDQAKKKYPEDE